MGLLSLTGLCVFAPVFGLGLHFHSADGSQGYVGLPRILLIAIGSAVFVYGFLEATLWSRPLFVLWLAASSIWSIFQNYATYSFLDYLGLLAADVFIVWILFFERGVRDYYARV
ncbi:MAG: hypothetical protein ACLQSR_00145 [Limisphaerales bacterium]